MNSANLEAKLHHLLSVYEELSPCKESARRFRHLICEKINVAKARDREFYTSLIASYVDDATRSQIRAIMNYDLYGYMPKLGRNNKGSISFVQKLSNEFCYSRHPNIPLVKKLLDLMKIIEDHPLYSKGMKKRAFVYIRIVLRNASSETDTRFYDDLIKKYRSGKDCFRLIRRYDLYGTMPKYGRMQEPKESGYSHLSGEFKMVVDEYVLHCEDRGLRSSTIYKNRMACGQFFNFMQKLSINTLVEITEDSLIAYFQQKPQHEGLKIIRMFFRDMYMRKKEYIYNKILVSLPMIPKRKQIYESLREDEAKLIEDVLLDYNTPLSLRDRAVGLLAYYTGMRSGDIASLKLENIDWNKDVISFNQHKTGEFISIPMRPVVGNGLYKYITEERPQCQSEYLFILSGKILDPIKPKCIYRASVKILNCANVRTKGGRKGMHLYRHHLAVSLLEKNVDIATVSNVLGHHSPRSIQPYISTDLSKLAKCALNIERFPFVQHPYYQL